jgi:hypothetical protein
MTNRTRRHPRRPLGFWAIFALSTALAAAEAATIFWYR